MELEGEGGAVAGVAASLGADGESFGILGVWGLSWSAQEESCGEGSLSFLIVEKSEGLGLNIDLIYVNNTILLKKLLQ